MSNITKEAVMDLREKTGAGLIDCKRALAETNGDLEEAISILRKKGVASAAKKAGREAGEGMQLAEIGRREFLSKLTVKLTSLPRTKISLVFPRKLLIFY